MESYRILSKAQVDNLALTPRELDSYVDLRPYINEAAEVTLQVFSASRLSTILVHTTREK